MYHHGMSTASQAFICFLPPGERRASPWPRSRWMTQGPIKHNPLPIPDIHHGQHHTQRQRSQRHRDGHRHLHLRCRLCPFAREDHRHWRHAVHPRRLPRRTVPRLASHIHTRHSGHRAHRLHDHRKQQCRGGAAQSAAFTVDNVRPYIVDFEMPSVIQGSGAQTSITITYSEPVSAASVTIFTSAEGGYSGGTPSDGGRKWTYQYWPKAANGTNYIGIYLSTFKD